MVAARFMQRRKFYSESKFALVHAVPDGGGAKAGEILPPPLVSAGPLGSLQGGGAVTGLSDGLLSRGGEGSRAGACPGQ